MDPDKEKGENGREPDGSWLDELEAELCEFCEIGFESERLESWESEKADRSDEGGVAIMFST